MDAEVTQQNPAPETADVTYAPWTEAQVKAINEFQSQEFRDPYASMGIKVWIATPEGFVEEEGGPVVQDWVHTEIIEDFSNASFPEGLRSVTAEES